jgi:hypothetical protein
MLAMVTTGFLMFPALTFAQAKNPLCSKKSLRGKEPMRPGEG